MHHQSVTKLRLDIQKQDNLNVQRELKERHKFGWVGNKEGVTMVMQYYL